MLPTMIANITNTATRI